ncbi:hypothetical protein B4158_0903 [Bacillus cereus]|nr:hypothetical protein B4158_0903 [Bacillus cereus]
MLVWIESFVCLSSEISLGVPVSIAVLIAFVISSLSVVDLEWLSFPAESNLISCISFSFNWIVALSFVSVGFDEERLEHPIGIKNNMLREHNCRIFFVFFHCFHPFLLIVITF